jgi:hypothetical protein
MGRVVVGRAASSMVLMSRHSEAAAFRSADAGERLRDASCGSSTFSAWAAWGWSALPTRRYTS